MGLNDFMPLGFFVILLARKQPVAKDRSLIERTTGTSRQARRPLQETVNAEKTGWRNRNQKLCAACCARYGVPSDGTGCREALSEDAAALAVFNGPECGNRAGAKRCSGGHFKGCVCFGADAKRLGNSGQRYERFCVHGGAVMDGQH